ncbi:hypothetical protein D3C78_1505220 [compost metagenome]
MLARKLLVNQVTDEATADNIINFLCSESGSHDYTINRVEALGLGLKVEKPNEELYQLIKEIYHDFKSELQLGQPFDAEAILGASNSLDYEAVRCLVEAPDACSYQIRTEMRLSRVAPLPGGPQNSINTVILNEGWKKYDQ